MSFHSPRHDLLTTIRKTGLTGGLQLCLDAGHEASLPAASTKWLDLAGGGYDFFRGTSTSSESTDPTINGTAGRRSVDEYLSFDGGDLLRYDTSNETWMENIHKAGGAISFSAWVYFASLGGNQGLCGTRGATTGNTGFICQAVSSANMQFQIRNAGTVIHQTVTSGGALVTGKWQHVFLSYNEALTDGTESRWFVDGVENTLNQTNGGTPSSGSASFTFEIGALGNAVSPMESGARIAQFAAWDRVIEPDNMLALFHQTRSKFGV